MKILAVNGSSRGRDGNTEQLLQAFLDGAGSAGAMTEVIYLKEKKINHCLGCLTCWTKTPGVCVHKDDMPEIIEKVLQVDVIVYATPVYVYTVTGIMKDFMDRHLPLLQPYTFNYGDRYGHPMRSGGKTYRAVLISNCGFPDRIHFAGMLETFRLMYSTAPNMELTAAILCSAGGALGHPSLREYIQWYLDACRAAGREVAERDRISPETQSVLDRQLADPEAYINNSNSYFDSVLAGQPE